MKRPHKTVKNEKDKKKTTKEMSNYVSTFVTMFRSILCKLGLIMFGDSHRFMKC